MQEDHPEEQEEAFHADSQEIVHGQGFRYEIILTFRRQPAEERGGGSEGFREGRARQG